MLFESFSSTGGTIIKTKTGLIHQSGNNYSSVNAPADQKENVITRSKHGIKNF
jgi:hypothetical protein